MFKRLLQTFKEAIVGKKPDPAVIAAINNNFETANKKLTEKAYWATLDSINFLLELSDNPMQRLDEAVEYACKSSDIEIKSKYAQSLIDNFVKAPVGQRGPILEKGLPSLFTFTEEKYRHYLTGYCEVFTQNPEVVDALLAQQVGTNNSHEKCQFLLQSTLFANETASLSQQPAFIKNGPTTLQ